MKEVYNNFVSHDTLLNRLTFMGRLKAVNYPPGKALTYTYDGVGNRLTKLEGGVTATYSYDEANQLSVKWTPTVRVTYSYDANGNTTLENNAGALTTNTWDIENHVTKVELPSAVINTMVYDGDGKRRRYEDSLGARNYIWDGENILLVTGGLDNITARNYTLRPELYGEIVSQRYSNATSFHHFDALGSTRNLTDSNQAISDTRDYKAFGATNGSSGSNTNRMWWKGRWGYYQQTDLGNLWVRARIVEPLEGRWKSRDPIKSVRNLYLYVWNAPLRIIDASGKDICVKVGRKRESLGVTVDAWTKQIGNWKLVSGEMTMIPIGIPPIPRRWGLRFIPARVPVLTGMCRCTWKRITRLTEYVTEDVRYHITWRCFKRCPPRTYLKYSVLNRSERRTIKHRHAEFHKALVPYDFPVLPFPDANVCLSTCSKYLPDIDDLSGTEESWPNLPS